jgi:hypothetical protein
MKGWRWLAVTLPCLAVMPWLGVTGCGGASASNSASSSEMSETALGCTPPDGGVSCPATPPSFVNDVLPILNRDCNSTCHGPMMGQWELADYSDVSDWASLIQLDLTDCAMPPSDAGAYPTSDRATVLAWIACGAPNN